MHSDAARERRRSTRVRLKVAIETKGVAEPLNCEGETVIVNLHGAFISTAVKLRVGMTIDIRVVMTGKRARATVIYVDREQPRLCGVALDQSQNISGRVVAAGRLVSARVGVVSADAVESSYTRGMKRLAIRYVVAVPAGFVPIHHPEWAVVVSRCDFALSERMAS